MKLKALRPLDGAYGRVAPGQEFEASPVTARSLLDRGLAIEVKEVPAPQNKAAPAARNKGVKAPLAGSPTGAGKPALSSRAARPRKPSASKKPKAAPAS